MYNYIRRFLMINKVDDNIIEMVGKHYCNLNDEYKEEITFYNFLQMFCSIVEVNKNKSSYNFFIEN